MRTKWWFASSKFQNNYSQLISTSISGSTDRDFKDAQKMTISVEGAWIRDDNDNWPNGDNDLIINTRHQFSGRPIIDKIHFYKQEVPSPEWVGPFFHPVVYATNDFNEKIDSIMLRVRVYDEDGLGSDYGNKIESAISSAGSAAAIAFPIFAPIAGLSSGVGSALLKLVDELDAHDKIIEGEIRLSVNKPENNAFDLLQPGFFICFSKEIDASNLFLGIDRKLHTSNSDGALEYANHSFILLRVDRAYEEAPDFIIDEKSATLLSEIESGKGERGTNALSFLTETLKAYNNFNRLKRYKELKDNIGNLTEDQKSLFDEIKNDPLLMPFIP